MSITNGQTGSASDFPSTSPGAITAGTKAPSLNAQGQLDPSFISRLLTLPGSTVPTVSISSTSTFGAQTIKASLMGTAKTLHLKYQVSNWFTVGTGGNMNQVYLTAGATQIAIFQTTTQSLTTAIIEIYVQNNASASAQNILVILNLGGTVTYFTTTATINTAVDVVWEIQLATSGGGTFGNGSNAMILQLLQSEIN